MTILLIVLVGVILLCLGVGGYLFYSACPRKPEKPWLKKEELEKTAYGEFYGHIVVAKKWLEDHEAQEIFVTSHDGLALRAQWVPAKNPRGTMLLAHGYHSCVWADFGPVFDFYHDQGMNLLLPDQRAHGKSEGKYCTFGVKESRDMQHWIAYHNEKLCHCPVVLSGLSMGASTMMYLADQPLPENVKGIIADCGFTSPWEILGHVFTYVMKLPSWPVVWAADLFARIFAGFRLREKSSLETLANSKLPVFLVHGLEDTFVPYQMTQRGYAACQGKKQLFMVEGASHGVSFLRAKEEYSARVRGFLQDVLEENP